MYQLYSIEYAKKVSNHMQCVFLDQSAKNMILVESL